MNYSRLIFFRETRQKILLSRNNLESDASFVAIYM